MENVKLEENELILLLKRRVDEIESLFYFHDSGVLRKIDGIELILFEMRRITIDFIERRAQK